MPEPTAPSGDAELFHDLARLCATRPADELFQAVVDRLTAAGRYAELFEALKLQLRHRLGLPLLASGTEQLDEPVQAEYEAALIDACRRVGLLLLDDGRIRDAWTYLRPVGNQGEVIGRLRRVEVSSENVDQLVEVLLYEGLDPPRGYQLLLEHFGTCNAITAYQSAFYGRPRPQRAAAAGLLVGHLYRELCQNIVSHAERNGIAAPPSASLSDLIRDCPQLFAEGGYHIDTTHLSSVINIAREVTDATHLRQALELADYGGGLDPSLQYPSEPPFEETYRTHRLWFAAQLGQEVEPALEYFRERAEQTDARHQGTQVIEYYVDLLDRLGRSQPALEESLRLIPAGVHTVGWAPSLLELAHHAGSYGQLIESARQRGELFGFLLGLLGQQGQRLL
ncbi:MAG: hypothetical protein U0795_15330 [Pirellulales bacterium]